MGHDAGVRGTDAGAAHVKIERMKWPDRAHATMTARRLGHDELGTWLGLPDDDEVWLVPDTGWWIGCWFARADAVAIDITMPARWTDDGLVVIGLDFRVISKAGEPRLVGDDDFEENCLAFEYPSTVVSGARTAAEEIHAAVSAGIAPFDWETGAGWFSILRAAG
jgi:hypothetical protein